MHALVWSILLVTSALAQKILLPKAQGPYDVTIRTSELVDFSRMTRAHEYRRLMVSAFSPQVHADPSCRSPDFLSKVARYYSQEFEEAYNITADFGRFVLPYCSVDVTYGAPSYYQKDEAENKPDQEPALPIVFFSPGSGATRFRYNAICAALASTGFLVLSIDHPYTVDIIEYPDGTTVKMTNVTENLAYLRRNQPRRVRDVSFILDSITNNATLRQLLFPIKRPDLEAVGIWGHSFGGSTAAQAVYQDKRFLGGINLDGSMVGPVIHNGFSQPFILWESVGHTRKYDYTWSDFYPKLTGFKRNLETADTQHNSYTDGQLLIELLGIDPTKVGLGTIDGKRDIEILMSYARDFFRFVLQGANEGLVGKPSNKFPEVTFVP